MTSYIVPYGQLEEISGIGKKLVAELRSVDITSVRQLARANINDLINIKGIGKASALKFIEQAKKILERKTHDRSHALITTADASKEPHSFQDQEDKTIAVLKERINDLEKEVARLSSYLPVATKNVQKVELTSEENLLHNRYKILKENINPKKKILKESEMAKGQNIAKRTSYLQKGIERKNSPLPKARRGVLKIINTHTDVEDFILSILPPGGSINIDRLIRIEELQKISLITLKNAVMNLLEREYIVVSKGGSRQKFGSIGTLTRIRN